MRNCITFRDVLYTSIIGRQTTSQWDAANVTLVEVLAMSPGDVIRSHCERPFGHFVLLH